jgi:spore coat protein CotH
MMRLVDAAAVLVLLSSCGGNGSSKPPADVFNDQALATYTITISPSDWDQLVATPSDSTWRHADLTWQSGTQTVTIQDIALHPSGGSSRIPNNPKPNLHLKFNVFHANFNLGGLHSLKLGSMTADPTMIRERFAYDTFRAAGLPTPREVHARVVVNGSYKGLYVAEERIHRHFVRRVYGEPMHQLYNWTAAVNDMTWQGTDPSLYVDKMFLHKMPELPDGAVEVRDLLDAVNNQPLDQVVEKFDVGQFIAFMACDVVTGNIDSYLSGPSTLGGSDFWSNNFYLYKSPDTDKFLFVVWDRDAAYWRVPDYPSTFAFDQRVLTKKLILDDPGNLARFRDAVRSLLTGSHSTDERQSRIDFLANQVKDAAFEDPYKGAQLPGRSGQPMSNQEWQNEVAALRSYVRLRNDALKAELGVK